MLKVMTITAALTLAAAGAHAKGHDQSGTDTPGTNVGAETVSAAQTLGNARSGGKGKGPQATPGRSNEAASKHDDD